MVKRGAYSQLWLSFFLFLPASRSSALDDTNCTAADMRIVCRSDGGYRSPYCDQNMSNEENCNAITRDKGDCYDTHRQVKEMCDVKKINGEGSTCGSIKLSNITSFNKSLVEPRLYYYRRHFTHFEIDEALINLTLPNPAWTTLEIQHEVVGGKERSLKCVKLTNRRAVDIALMYDCRYRNEMENYVTNVQLMVLTDTGQGASYLFKEPEGSRINAEKTCPSDWHVFFYIHQEAIYHYKELPVTVQSSPYGRVKYRIALAKCRHPEDKECTEELEHKFETKDTSDDLWTVRLSRVINPGNYMVTVQMIADWCPKDGCHVSMSPKFEVAATSVLFIIIMTLVLVLLSLIAIVTMVSKRRKLNKNILRYIKKQQTTVLLVYHPESQGALRFVKTVADFLRHTCYATPLMVDSDVCNENPTSWTKRHMNDANRVLFIIPRDPEAQSITTIRNQFQAALIHCTGHEFTTSPQHTKRLAKLVHPASGDVPSGIRDIRRFELSHNPAALANWLHEGSFLDQICFWLPHIMSSTKKNITPVWKDIMSVVMETDSQPTTTNNESPRTRVTETQVEMERGSSSSELSDGEADGSFCNTVFDPEIPDVDGMFCESDEESTSSLENEDDDIFQ